MKKVDAAFKSREDNAKRDHINKLRGAVSQEDRQRFEREYRRDMTAIKGLKWEQYEVELAKERSARRGDSREPVQTTVPRIPRAQKTHTTNSNQHISDSKGKTKETHDYEPDGTWKVDTAKRIDSAFESLLNFTKETDGINFREGALGQMSCLRFEEEWKDVIAMIVALKKKEYNHELAEQRGSRGLASPSSRPSSKYPGLTQETSFPAPCLRAQEPRDYEPHERWKEELAKKIDAAFAPMVVDAKEDLASQLRKAVVTPEDRTRFEREYEKAMATVRGLKKEQYDFELAKERSARRWARGKPPTHSITTQTRSLSGQAPVEGGVLASNSISHTTSHPTGVYQSQRPSDERRRSDPYKTPASSSSTGPKESHSNVSSTTARIKKRPVTIEEVPDDVSIQSYLPDDGPILDLRENAGSKRQGKSSWKGATPERDPVLTTMFSEDASRLNNAMKEIGEAEMRFGGGSQRPQHTDSGHAFWFPPNLKTSAPMVSTRAETSHSRRPGDIGQRQGKWPGGA